MRVTTNLGGLTTVLLQQDDGPPQGLVVLCHGFGAPGDDLVPVTSALLQAAPRLARVRFAFPEAPLELSGLGGGARAWWPLGAELLERLQARGGHDSALEPPGLREARQALHRLLEAATREAGLGLERVVLGGFSQGAMTATDVALREETCPAGLLIWSGAPLAEATWRQRLQGRHTLPVFQSHGTVDPVLPFSLGQTLHRWMVDAGLRPQLVTFHGGHGIPPEAVTAAARFLERVLLPAS